MDNTTWFLEGEGVGELSEETVQWMLEHARWEDDLLISPM